MNENLKKIKELTKGMDISMLTTITEEGKLHSRPMSTQDIDEEGNIWFFTHTGTDKVGEIEHNTKVNVNYMGKHYVSIYGTAEVIEDDAQKKAKWTKEVELWFQSNYDDPSIRLIKVNSESAEYWESEGAKTVIEIAKSILKKEEPKPGINEEVDL